MLNKKTTWDFKKVFKICFRLKKLKINHFGECKFYEKWFVVFSKKKKESYANAQLQRARQNDISAKIYWVAYTQIDIEFCESS